MCRPGRIGFEFLPQSANEDPQILDFIHMRRAPHLAQQLAMRHDLAGMRDEVAQQFELLWRQLDLDAVAGHAPAHEVD